MNETLIVNGFQAAGVAAGKAAGAKVIAITGTAPREELAPADRIVDSLREIWQLYWQFYWDTLRKPTLGFGPWPQLIYLVSLSLE